jgi:23S rRNA pseudouridine2604 synthase
MMKADKYIAQNSDLSRGKAYDLIDQKKVMVNGKIATYSTVVKNGDKVEVDGVIIKEVKRRDLMIAYHKPKGVICTTEKMKGNIIDAIGLKEKIYPVGRLDKDSEGLILLTNITELIDKISNPKFEHEKEYVVTLNLPIRKKFLEEVAAGTDIGAGVHTEPCVIKQEEGTKRIFRILLKQGLNRQIRRMCNKYDYQVLKLLRVRVMHIELGKLKAGEWRELSEKEINDFRG